MDGILGLGKHGLNTFEQWAIVGVLITAFISLAYAWFLRGKVLKKDKGTEKMQEVYMWCLHQLKQWKNLANRLLK